MQAECRPGAAKKNLGNTVTWAWFDIVKLRRVKMTRRRRVSRCKLDRTPIRHPVRLRRVPPRAREHVLNFHLPQPGTRDPARARLHEGLSTNAQPTRCAALAQRERDCPLCRARRGVNRDPKVLISRSLPVGCTLDWRCPTSPMGPQWTKSLPCRIARFRSL